MRRIGLAAGVILIGGAFMAAATAAQAQEATRVAPFDMLDGPRIGLPADASDAPMRELCPDDTEMCRRYWDYTGYFVRNATIPTRDRELVILRTAWLSRGDYIWGRHNLVGQEAGLTPEQISRITVGPDAPEWEDFDRALLAAADELHTSRFISEATWAALDERYTEDELREVVLIVGNYTQLAMFQNTLGALLPPDIEGLPDEGGQ
jgi:alkylhydroperoxidase family enzyme